ncbi:MFS transporter [Kribbella sp. NPDC055071]
MDLTAYRELWRTSGVMALLASALTARMPVMASMVPLSFLAKDAAGTFGWAGVVAGAYSVGMGFASVVWSRLADRRGIREVVIGTGMAWGALMIVVALLPDSWFRALPVAAALAGMFVAPVTSAVRAGWPQLVDGPRLRTIYALDASSQELLFIVGPLLGALVVTIASPHAGVMACGITAAGAIWWFGLLQPPHRLREKASGERLTIAELVLHRHRFALLIAFLCMIASFSGLSLGIVAVADAHGNRLVAGILETVTAIGSLLGGLVSGALPGKKNSYVWRRLLVLAILSVGCALATPSLAALMVLLFATGSLMAPTIGSVYERLGVLTPAAARTEMFGWMVAAGQLGAALGWVLAGAVVEAFGLPYAWVLMAGLTLIAALAVLWVPPQRPADSTDLDGAAVAG